MKKRRLLGFSLAILAGLLLGLVYGWFINPPGARNTTLDSLRSDYQADYVLMVAERYAVDRDAAAALVFLEKIAPRDPYGSVRLAMVTGQQLGYSAGEMQALTDLENALVLSSSGSSEAAP